MTPLLHDATPPLEVFVPCSTSNLGPGFDLLGVCLSLYLRVHIVRGEPGHKHRYEQSGGFAREWPDPAGDLLFRAFRRVAPAESAYVFAVNSEIPVGRGFGSSGAAVAAGLLLGAALSEEELPIEHLLRIGVELEGHPDNVTASLFGGCTLCHPDAGADGAPVRIANEVHPSIGFAVAWPASPLATERAREALPASVPFADAVENPRRLALLLEGLRRGDPELIALGGEDRLHTAARLPLIPGATEALAAARAAGAWLPAISGAGSGLVALGPKDAIEAIGEAMALAFDEHGEGGTARVVEPVFGTPTVIPTS